MKLWEDNAREDLRHILQAALTAVTPQVVMNDQVRVADGVLSAGDVAVDLAAANVRIAAVGKAAAGMAAQATWVDAAERVIVTPDRVHVPGWEVIRGSHPVPDQGSLDAGERVRDLAEATGPDDLLILLLSGGASAVCEAPAVPLEDLQATTSLVMKAGAPIHELNAVRKHLSRLKGGRIAQTAKGRVLTLAISDVRGDDLSVIGSGPTAPDPSTYADAERVLQDRGVWEKVPASVRAEIERGLAGEVPETPKPGDAVFDRVANVVISGNGHALAAAREAAESRGYVTTVHSDALVGEARERAQDVLRLAGDAEDAVGRDGKPRCVLLGGETTVTVRGGGLGGRNQELTLACVEALAGRSIVVANMGTDGIDGPTDAAGAVADGYTKSRGEGRNLEVKRFLEDNDAYHYFEPLNDLIKTGPTGTNVMDLCVVLVGQP